MNEKLKKKIAKGLVALVMMVLIFIRFHSAQDKPKNEIRILIDRAPNTLDASQSPDAWARKIIPLLTQAHYSLKPPYQMDDFELAPPLQAATKPILHFKVVRDEISRALVFLSNEADILYDSLSLSRTAWIKTRGYQVLEAPGFSLSFLGFQVQDPVLANLKVRQAISRSLPVDQWVKYKFFNWVEIVPETPHQSLIEAENLLNEAGFPRRKNGIRFTLHYVTTPVREGNEMAFLIREALGKVGIKLEIVPLETSLFYQRLKRGDFQLFASRMLRNSAGDSIADLLSEKGQRNYFHYSGLTAPSFSWDEVKTQMARDVPLVPLFVWKHAAVLSKRIQGRAETQARLDDTFLFLQTLEIKKP